MILLKILSRLNHTWQLIGYFSDIKGHNFCSGQFSYPTNANFLYYFYSCLGNMAVK